MRGLEIQTKESKKARGYQQWETVGVAGAEEAKGNREGRAWKGAGPGPQFSVSCSVVKGF